MNGQPLSNGLDSGWVGTALPIPIANTRRTCMRACDANRVEGV